MRALALPACVRIFKYCQFKVHFIMEIPMSIDIPSITQVKFFDFLSGFFFLQGCITVKPLIKDTPKEDKIPTKDN